MRLAPFYGTLQGMFVLIDLESQAHTVARSVRGWQKEAILAWLSRQGELTYSSSGGGLFAFRSPVGFRAIFRLDNDQFTFVLYHTTWQP
jgi:hypothetical protein